MMLPAIPCGQCGHVGRPDLEVVQITPTTDEHRYSCASCFEPIVVVVLGDVDDVNDRGRALEADGLKFAVDVALVDVGPRPPA